MRCRAGTRRQNMWVDRSIRTHASHGDSDICSCEYRCIVDTITDECQSLFFILCTQQFLHLTDFVCREQFCMHFINAKFCGNGICSRLSIIPAVVKMK